ncbi:MAG: response regulator transcription factor [Bacteroidales bacterium]|nr:response regulator transcription factor [Bacteroidales bacterium]
MNSITIIHYSIYPIIQNKKIIEVFNIFTTIDLMTDANMITCIAIEDEPLAMKKLVGFIEKIEYLKLSHSFSNCIDAIGFLKENPVDLIFLDIQMEDLTGIQFLQAITQKPYVIIITAYDKYALKGYELEVNDYLLKPYTFERFLSAAERIYNKKINSNIDNRNYIFVKTEYRLEKINLAEILYIEGKGEYLQIVTPGKKIMTLQNFKSIEETLQNSNFVRVHKSFIVAFDKIESIERNRIKIKDVLIPVSDTYKEEFYSRIKG